MSNRFDLDHAIAAWLRPYRHRRVFLREDLDELERHLRDHIAHLRAEGCSEEDAFRRAVRAVGASWEAEDEYRKVYWGKLRRQRRRLDELFWKATMLTNYLKIALRNARLHPGYTFINVFGLAIGLGACLLILQYAHFELSYDAFHTHADDLYRLTNDRFQNGERTQHGVITYPSVAKALKSDYPEVLDYTRLFGGGRRYVRRDDVAFEEGNVVFADSAFLDMFSFPLLAGDARTALAKPFSILLSDSKAEQYFGPAWRQESVVGKTLIVDNHENMTVTGVFENVPANAHMQFDFLISYATLAAAYDPIYEDSWTFSNFHVYLRLAPGTDPTALERKLVDFSERHFEGTKVTGSLEVFHLQPLRDVHLYSDYEYEMWAHGDATTVWAMVLVAGFILVIAWLNYVNLSTARALERAKEVGVRKVIGAERGHLVRQFLVEAALLNAAGMLGALAIAFGAQPFLQQWIGGAFADGMPAVEAGLALFALFGTGIILSGLYPALLLSSFKPVSILKGQLVRGGRGERLWKGLVVVQFALSFGLIAGTFIVYQQVQFMEDQDLGMNIDQVLVLRGPRLTPWDSTYFSNVGAFKSEVRRIPGVQSATTTQRLPGNRTGRIFGLQRVGGNSDVQYTTSNIGVDHEYFETFGMKILAGRGFTDTDHNLSFDAIQSVVLNASLAQRLGFEDAERAIHERLQFWGKEWEVVGVVADHHQQSLRVPKEPIAFLPLYSTNNSFCLKVRPGQLREILPAVKATYLSFFPGNAFDYFFLDDHFDAQYRADRRFRGLFAVFAGLGVLLACLGLFGLALFTAARRTKEIGVRKVLGASVSSLVALLLRDFVRLVALATLVACPLTYLAMNEWLASYAYHVRPGWLQFALPALVVLVIAVLTVSYQTLKAALVDPVKSLRYE